jgi:hypothetical protein
VCGTALLAGYMCMLFALHTGLPHGSHATTPSCMFILLLLLLLLLLRLICVLRHMCAVAVCPGCDAVVPLTRDPAGRQDLLHTCGHLVHWLHLRGDDQPPPALSWRLSECHTRCRCSADTATCCLGSSACGNSIETG